MASLFRSSASVSAPSSTAAAGSFDNHVPSPTNGFSWLYTTVAIVAGLLVLEQSVYRYKKRHLPGAKWTIPIIGKFADSVSPSMENYMKQWLSGPLSAISVFNM